MSKFYASRPQASYNKTLFQLFPLDNWSRKIIKNYCTENTITFTELPTTMGENTLEFSEENYKQVKDFIDNYSLE